MRGRTTRLTAPWLVTFVGSLLFWLLTVPTAAASCGSVTYEGAPAPATAEPPDGPELPSHVCVSTLPNTASIAAAAAALAAATAHGIRLYRSGATTGPAGPDTERVIRALALQGHAPQRHLFPDTAALKARKGRPVYKDGSPKLKPSGHVRTRDHVDPACDRGTCTKEVLPDKSTLSDHFCGDYATKFRDPADFVRAEAHLREKALRGSPDLVEATIEEIFGPGDHTARFEGYYVDPANPKNADGSINLLPVDLRGGHISAIYKQAPDGIWLLTMHPSPQDERHP
ncbi:hypothetical protein AB0B78_11415 [Streptomyces sp. NPDC040724]|uniref:hypothetical protein n=1 Tax=Streptomyces sp. NPDC040724 TaxID=3155612 RepID=UPI0033C6CE68